MATSPFELFIGALPRLTWTEERLLHALWAADGGWTHISDLLRAGWQQWYRGGVPRTFEAHLVRVNICRLRKKLQGSAWQIDSGITGHEPLARAQRQYVGCYRLTTTKQQRGAA